MNRLKMLYRSGFAHVIATLLLLTIYVAYMIFVFQANQGPIDYETFMRIGTRFVSGEEIYIENSYYPIPYVVVFGLLSLLPRSISIAIWLASPIAVALIVTRFKPYTLLFAPVFSHFSGGQSSVFGLIGFFGYRANLNPQKKLGGFFLALTLLKPQLGIVPVSYAIWQWVGYLRKEKKVPGQLISFACTTLFMYLPAFLINPQWVWEWLAVPRPMSTRAISSAIPRLLFLITSPNNTQYWLLLIMLSSILVSIVWRLKGPSHNLDVLMLLNFIINPLVHDYDLIQTLPIIWGPIMPLASILLSIPGWWTITTQYANDVTWITFTVIAPGLLACYIYQSRRAEKLSQSIPNRWSG